MKESGAQTVPPKRAEGPGMHWGPLKSAEKPHPCVDHEPMGPGAVGSVGGGVRGGVGVVGWGLGVGGGRVRTVWGWGLGVGQGPYIGPALAAMQVEG